MNLEEDISLEELALRLEIKSTFLRESLVKALLHAGSGHTGGSSSSLDILNALYNRGIVKHDPLNPNWEERDIVIEAGHKAPAKGVVLADSGYFGKDGLQEYEATYRDFGSIFQGHACNHTTPGVEISTGSLGQIISPAAGMAYSFNVQGTSQKVYVIVGDGELQEGQNWEALMSAAKYNLSNLVVIVDRNLMQIDDATEKIMPLEPLKEKFEAFGCKVNEVDVHKVGKQDINYKGLLEILQEAKDYRGNKPQVVIANTVKAFAMGKMENIVDSHGVAPNPETAKEIIESLRERRKSLEDKLGEAGKTPYIWIPNKGKTRIVPPAIFEPIRIDLAASEFSAFLPGKKVATRDAYGAVLKYLARVGDALGTSLYVLGADLEKSTRGNWIDQVESFDRRRHINLGIAEANMIGWLAGICAASPKDRKTLAFASSFAVFVPGRCFDQIRNTLAYSRFSGNLIGTHGGLFTGKDGGSHQAIEDFALARVIPGLRVYSPSDALLAVKAIEAAINYPGPAYIRLAREPTEVRYTTETVPEPHKITRLTEFVGKGSFVATGHMLGYALEAAELLYGQGFPIGVYDINCLKPLDGEALIVIGGVGPVVTIEDHNIINGLGAAIAEHIYCPLNHRVGINDRFGQSGRPVEDLLPAYNMTVKDIYKCMRTLLWEEKRMRAPYFDGVTEKGKT